MDPRHKVHLMDKQVAKKDVGICHGMYVGDHATGRLLGSLSTKLILCEC